MPQEQRLNSEYPRTSEDRRRFPASMIRDYCEYEGPERRSGIERRRPRATLAPSMGPVPTIKTLR